MMSPDQQQRRYYEQQYRNSMQYQRQQQRQYEQQQREMIRAYERQQVAVERAYKQQQREVDKLDRQYSRYPKLTDNLVKICLARDIHQQYVARGIRVPPVEELSRIIKYRRIRATKPEPYIINKKQVYGIKHACKFRGVSINPIRTLPIVYVSPHGVKYNHDYNYKVYYHYCTKCHSVIYYFANNIMEGESNFGY